MNQETLSMFLWKKFHLTTKPNKDGSISFELVAGDRGSRIKFRAHSFQDETCQLEQICSSPKGRSFIQMWKEESTCSFDQVEETLNQPICKIMLYMSKSCKPVHPNILSQISIGWRRMKDDFLVDLSTGLVNKNRKEFGTYSCVERVCDLL